MGLKEGLKDEAFRKAIFEIREKINRVDISSVTKMGLHRIVDRHVDEYLRDDKSYSQKRRNAWELRKMYNDINNSLLKRDNVIDLGYFLERRLSKTASDIK